MNNILSNLVRGFQLEGSAEKDSQNLFMIHGHEEDAVHSLKVAETAGKIAQSFNQDADKAALAAYLHDISNVIPVEEMISYANNLDIEVLKEEIDYPRMLHQKLSRSFAINVFNIHDEEILNAIECHTTLKSNPNPLDMVLFISDKISWDKEDNASFIDSVYDGLQKSLEHGCYAYVKNLYLHRADIKVIHPLFIEAYHYLHNKCDK